MEFIRINARPEDPNTLLEEWLAERQNSVNIDLNPGPLAITLATISVDGKRPSARTVLLRGYEHNAFKIYTSLDSAKAKEIALNNNGALVLQWALHHPNGKDLIKKQVRVDGTLKRLPIEEETEYFYQEPIASQIRAVVVKFGAVVEDRDKLEQEANEIFKKVSSGSQTIQKPDNFGGFVLTPNQMDFYVGFQNAIADRVCYYRKSTENDSIESANVWSCENLGV